MLPFLVSIQVDDQRKNVLTSITRNKKGAVRHESDHNSIITKFGLNWNKNKEKKRIEMFNYKDEISQKKLKEITSNNSTLSSIFETNKYVNTETKHFMKRLNGMLHESIKQIRISDISNKEIDTLFKQEKTLKGQNDQDSKKKMKEVEEELSNKIPEDMYEIVKEEVEKVNSDEGGFNSGHLWRLKSKLRPKANTYPNTMINKEGEVKTSKTDIDKLTVYHYKNVLANRPMRNKKLEQYRKEREYLCEQRINKAKLKVTPDWIIDDVKYVINNLKRKKSRDSHGLSNELIQCGDDLVLAITGMMNNIKRQQKFPEFLE